MGENQLAGDEVSRFWVEEIRTAGAPLVNSQSQEVLEGHRPWEL